MTDIKDLLEHAGRSAAAPPSPEVVDADARRGRTALLRRRRRRAVASSIGSTVAAAAIVATAIVVGSPDGASEAPTAQPDRVTTPSTDNEAAGDGVKLVAYDGKQPRGFYVELVPEGWYIQEPAHAAFSLTIAENGDNSHPDSFAGKIAVMLFSKSFPQKLPSKGEPVEVNGKDGVVTRGGGIPGLNLTYFDAQDRLVEIQSPGKLGWSTEQLVEFAEGVTVTDDAKAGIG